MAALFLDTFYGAEFHSRPALRLRSRHSAAHPIFDVGLEMQAHLGIHLAFHTSASEKAVKEGATAGDRRHDSSRTALRTLPTPSLRRLHCSVSTFSCRLPAGVIR